MESDQTNLASTRAPGTVLLYAVFFATGIAEVLPGAMLPTLLLRWHLNDAQGGSLFLLFFLGSTAGALLSRGSLPKSVVRGCLAVTAGLAWLALASRGAAFPAVALYGFGLGIAMTSVSLLQARRCVLQRTAEMARINLIWAIGACLGPWLVLRAADRFGAGAALIMLAGFFAIASILVLRFVPDAKTESAMEQPPGKRRLPFLLLLMIPLATGIEAASGGWLTSYSNRSGQTFGEVIGVVTCFWAGMLLSRFLQTQRRVAHLTMAPLLAAGPWVMFAALFILVSASRPAPMLAGATLLGIGAGPMYPLLISLALRGGGADNILFVLGGCGAAAVPFLTGVVSRTSGSLHTGILVPLLGAFVMACLGVAAWRSESQTYPS